MATKKRKKKAKVKAKVKVKRKKAAKKKVKVKARGFAGGAPKRRAELKRRTMPAPAMPDLSNLESMVAQASMDSAERLVSEATKFDIGIAHNGMALPSAELPTGYGTDRVVLLIVDPAFVFTYWEVTQESLKVASEQAGPSAKLTLRFYDITETGTTRGSRSWDIEVFDRLGNWYLKLASPEQMLCLEIGVKTATGEFHSISRSNVMRLPTQGLAKPGPIKWMVVTPSGEKLVSDAEEYTDADLDLLKQILGPYFYDLLMRGRLASITGSSVEAVFYDVENLNQGHSPSSGQPWSQKR